MGFTNMEKSHIKDVSDGIIYVGLHRDLPGMGRAADLQPAKRR